MPNTSGNDDERGVGHRGEALQHRQKELIEKLLRSATDGIAAFDTNYEILLFNPAMERITGLPARAVIGKKVYDVFPFLVKKGEDRLIAAALRGEFVEVKDEVFSIPQSGRVGRYEARYSPLTDDQGSVIGGLAVVRDVTEQWALQEQLLHAQKMEVAGRLAGGVAHDFNNLLTVILGEVTLALRPTRNDAEVREALVRIRESAQRATRVTRQLLTFSRRNFAAPESIGLDDLVERILPMAQHLVGDGIVLHFERGGRQACVRADPGQLEQVLMNLVVNARDAMTTGGELTVRCSVEELEPSSVWRMGRVERRRYGVLSVSDTGSGIAPDIVERIFEPFFTTKPGATGLGLSTCFGVVEHSGGDISVETGSGRTTFRVCLPLVEAGGAKEPPVEEIYPRGVEHILVVEDEAGVRDVTAAMLRELGYTVYEAVDGVAALQFIEQHTAGLDLVLSDVVMPRLGGRELSERLRRVRSDLPVLFMSGYADDHELRRRIKQDGLPILEKPFSPTALASSVRRLLDNARTCAPSSRSR